MTSRAANHPAVVIGAGVNGLVAAHRLARRGRRVLVLERRADPAPNHGEILPDAGWVPPRIVRDLDLHLHGFQLRHPDPWIGSPLPGGGRLDLWLDPARSAEAIRRVSPADASRWPEFCARMRRLASVLESLYSAPPPDLMSRDLGDLLRLAALGWRVRRLGKQSVVDLLRILPMPVADLLDEWFENDALKGALGAGGVLHLCQGPRSAGTSFLFLHHHAGSPAGVFRPPRSNLGRVLAGAAPAGLEIRRGVGVRRITVREGRAAGVVLDDGDEIAASLVLSNADPRSTLCDLVDPGWLDPELVRSLRHIRCRGVTARVSLELAGTADFDTLAVAPSLDYLERAYDDVKYGRPSRHPYLEARAVKRPAGAPGVEVHVQWVPRSPTAGDWDETGRRRLGDLVVETLEPHAPGLRDKVVGRTVLVPSDLEREFGYPEGHACHGELSLDQVLFMRPVPECARYRTPIRGLYLCGPGTHPGGGIAGASGFNAARQVLADYAD